MSRMLLPGPRLRLVLLAVLAAALSPAGAIPLPRLGRTIEASGGTADTTGKAATTGSTAARSPLPASPRARGDAPAASGVHLSAGLGSKGFRTFTDEEGRERVFHGVNAVVKGPPWLPTSGAFNLNTSLGADDFSFLQDLGVNVIRLGVMWAGVEPVRGQYNTTYLKQAKALAAEAAQYGIYTLIDMHQDVMSEKFCGEGVPGWAAQPSGTLGFPLPRAMAYTQVDPITKFPSGKDCNKLGWPNYYLTEAASTAFQNLYDNKDGLLDAWGAMWAQVALTFKGDKHIIGLELINEPWAGDVVHNPSLLLPGEAARQNLQPAYDSLAKAIRAVDPTVLIFFEGVTWAQPGFKAVPGGAAFGEYSVLAYHHYEIPAGPRLGNTSTTDVKARISDAGHLGAG
eukprot:CAMPEP_0173380962 /NCGR_PEP_ID=MMETSP1356-20130122/3497_1 /TAXON_ID=77927 ORGANISM="Hemiselmis virescens, Strain PCC157" /NCGR_SAMPLE_ID=MMETSP1356 /ASSEMBLY_ACC=CAM_ASM_000847 /LENGTH=397 /DNA_ID=CAMNT_0014334687 /DNA_START=1 /DNA_END=1190 /DNA_ORIENTATION=-